MATSPYRVPAQAGPASPPAAATRPLDLATVLAFSWMVTLLRVVAGLARAEAPNRELDLAWLILIAAPVLIWSELAGRRAR